jgi:hypothetical protein
VSVFFVGMAEFVFFTRIFDDDALLMFFLILEEVATTAAEEVGRIVLFLLLLLFRMPLLAMEEAAVIGVELLLGRLDFIPLSL